MIFVLCKSWFIYIYSWFPVWKNDPVMYMLFLFCRWSLTVCKSAALFGVSPITIFKVKAKFHIRGDVGDRPWSGHPKKTTPQEDRFLTLSALSCFLHICSQGLLDNMADDSLPRQSGTGCTQPISNLIGLPGRLPWLPPSPSGPFALVSATRALEPEHMEKRYVQRWVQILPTAVGS